jgi:mono/diheme cytochrome c family protein
LRRKAWDGTSRAVRVVAFALLLAACHGDAAEGPVDASQVFASACAKCHGPRGQPSEQMVVRFGVRDLTAPEFRVRATSELVEAQVRGGSKNKLMPAFEGALTDPEIKAVAHFVASSQFLARP